MTGKVQGFINFISNFRNLLNTHPDPTRARVASAVEERALPAPIGVEAHEEKDEAKHTQNIQRPLLPARSLLEEAPPHEDRDLLREVNEGRDINTLSEDEIHTFIKQYQIKRSHNRHSYDLPKASLIQDNISYGLLGPRSIEFLIEVYDKYLGSEIAPGERREVVEAGAGSGYNARQFHKAGFKTTALDRVKEEIWYFPRSFHPITRDENIEPVLEARVAKAMCFFCWLPPNCSMASDMLLACKRGKCRMIVSINEHKGGSTANNEYFDMLDSSEWTALKVPKWAENISLAGQEDSLSVYVDSKWMLLKNLKVDLSSLESILTGLTEIYNYYERIKSKYDGGSTNNKFIPYLRDSHSFETILTVYQFFHQLALLPNEHLLNLATAQWLDVFGDSHKMSLSQGNIYDLSVQTILAMREGDPIAILLKIEQEILKPAWYVLGNPTIHITFLSNHLSQEIPPIGTLLTGNTTPEFILDRLTLSLKSLLNPCDQLDQENLAIYQFLERLKAHYSHEELIKIYMFFHELNYAGGDEKKPAIQTLNCLLASNHEEVILRSMQHILDNYHSGRYPFTTLYDIETTILAPLEPCTFLADYDAQGQSPDLNNSDDSDSDD